MSNARPSIDPLEQVRAYHQRTKHRFERYAAGPGYMDWSTQPDPFRRFTGAEQIPLPLRADVQAARFADLFQPEWVPVQPLTLETLGVLLELSFGLSAWKAYGGDRWALRCNPSSGNLHPTEVYVVFGAVDPERSSSVRSGKECRNPDATDGSANDMHVAWMPAVHAGMTDVELEPGVYHYQSHDHVLERRCRVDLPFAGLLVGLSSIHWREAWKYGERAFRYCQHDIGHALGALRYAAGVLGWEVRLLDDWGDADVARLLGLDRDGDFGGAEREAPDVLCRVGPGEEAPIAVDRLLDGPDTGHWQGQANVLSPRHSHQWPVIDEIHRATHKLRTEPARAEAVARPPLLPTPYELVAAQLIRHRRSAQAFDGVTSISAEALWRMLDATLPRTRLPPFDAWPWPPRVHLLLFVHRVQSLAPGLYLFLRRDGVEEDFRLRTREESRWQPPANCPEHLRIFRLAQANCQQAARSLCCHQDIAGDGAFSLGMLAEFDETLAEASANYRRLFWECGLIGQALYLEAEAAGVRGTGIGCFFDDPVHELLGLADTRYQSLYHFTVGGPVQDDRLQTLPPYGHLQR